MPLMSFGEYARHRGCTLRAVQKALGDPDAAGVRHGRIAGGLVEVPGAKWPKIDSDLADHLWALNTDAAKRSTLFTPRDAADPGLAARSAVQAIAQRVAAPLAASAGLPGGLHQSAPLAASAGLPGGLHQAAATDLPTTPAHAADQASDLFAGAGNMVQAAQAAQAAQSSPSTDPADDLEDDASSSIRHRYHAARADSQEIDAENKRLDLEERRRSLVRYDEALQAGVTLLRSLRDSLLQIGARIAPELAVLEDPYLIEQRVTAEIEACLAAITAERLLTPETDDDDGPEAAEAGQPVDLAAPPAASTAASATTNATPAPPPQ